MPDTEGLYTATQMEEDWRPPHDEARTVRLCGRPKGECSDLRTRGDGLAADLATCVRLRDQALAEIERLRSIESSWAALAEGYIAQRDEARAALVSLCDLKRLKDRLPAVVEPGPAMEEYRHRRPLAWAEAFRVAYSSQAG